MKTSTLALVTAATLGATAISQTSAHAEDIRTPGRFGLGLGSGTLANGLSAKYFAAKSHAFQFHLGAYGGGGFKDRWGRVDGFGVGFDYLFEMPKIVRAGDVFDLAWNVGIGGGLGFRDRNDDFDGIAIAVAGVIGLEFNFLPIPLDIVIEWRPSILVVPSVHGDLIDFTGQIRYYF